MAERIPVAGPSITEREIEYVTDAARHGWYERWNEYPSRFERAFADYVGSPYAISTTSCTAAIHLSLASLGLGPGDEVIVPEITWVATANPVCLVGATPVFADVEEADWCVSARTIAERITSRTRAVIVVDLYGNTPQMDEILDLCRRRGLPIIEDAAEAVGARYRDRPAGALGDIGVFSFHGSKTLTTGEGGMWVTGDPALYRRALSLSDQGRDPDTRDHRIEHVGLKARMGALPAAFGLAQLERIDELLARKREAFGWYRERLADRPGVRLNPEPPDVDPSYWMATAMFDPSLGLSKESVIAYLGERGIECRPFFYPLSSMPAFAELPSTAAAREENRVAYDLSARGVNLPSSLSLTAEQVDRVADALDELLAGGGRGDEEWSAAGPAHVTQTGSIATRS